MNRIRHWLLWVGGCCSLGCMITVQAMVVYDPANYIQNKLSALNSAKMLLNQAKEVRYQLSLYQNDLRNMRHLPRAIWDSADNELHELITSHPSSQGIHYTARNAAEHFDHVFSLQSNTNNPFDLSHHAMATLKNAMEVRRLHANQFSQEAKQKVELERIADRAEGHTQLLQANHRLAAAQIGQMQKLRQLLLDQNNTQDVMYARELALDQARYEQHKQWLTKGIRDFPSLGVNPGFGPENLTAL